MTLAVVKDEMPGFKDSKGKLRLDLLPFGPLETVARVLMHGLEQPGYSENNWQHVEGGRREYLGAALRHLFAVMRGEPRDKKSGESHIAHAACDLLMALWHEENAESASKAKAAE